MVLPTKAASSPGIDPYNCEAGIHITDAGLSLLQLPTGNSKRYGMRFSIKPTETQDNGDRCAFT